MGLSRAVDLSELVADIAAVKTDVEGLDADMEIVKQSVGNGLNGIASGNSDKLDTVSASVGSGLGGRVDTIDGVVDAISLKLGETPGTKLAHIETDVDTAIVQLNAIAGSIGSTLADKVEAIQTSVGTNLDGRITALQNLITAAAQVISTINTSVGASHAQKLAAVKSVVDAINTSLGSGAGTKIAAILAAINKVHPVAVGHSALAAFDLAVNSNDELAGYINANQNALELLAALLKSPTANEFNPIPVWDGAVNVAIGGGWNTIAVITMPDPIPHDYNAMVVVVDKPYPAHQAQLQFYPSGSNARYGPYNFSQPVGVATITDTSAYQAGVNHYFQARLSASAPVPPVVKFFTLCDPGN